MGFIHEHIILPFSDMLKGEKVHHYFRQLREAEQWNEVKIRAFQEERMRKMVQYAAKEVPFYREWFSGNAIHPEDIQTLDDLWQLPIVNKDLMRSNGIDAFSSEGFPKKERLYSRSSGSTGEPFAFYESKLSYSVNMASKLRTWYQAGYCLGDSYMKITNGVRTSKIKALQDRFNRCSYRPFYSINDETLISILEKIEKEKPVFIRSYPAPLYLLAQYRNNHQGFNYCPRHVFTTGSTLPQAYREEIERAFGCDVIDSYSCEGTPNTYETTAHNGYSICRYYGIIEVLDNQDKPIVNGVGRVVSTDLWNYAHPFVRYDTQDLVEVQNGKIIRIMGRECECFLTVDGVMITVHNLTTFFAHDITTVSAYRLVRKKDNSIEFQLVVDDGFDERSRNYIVEYWSSLLNVPVNVSIVDNIPLMQNNKRLTIVEEK